MKKKPDLFKICLYTVYGITLTVYAYFLFQGLSYYTTPYHLRPHHPFYRNLRPAGFRGHAFGFIGSAMMVLMLAYSLRKRIKIFQNWGPLNRWLDVHIYLGIFGPLLIILHTAFKVQGLVAVSFWSMITVALSGVLGRYLYLQIPRNLRGEELDRAELERAEKMRTLELENKYGIAGQDIEQVENMMSPMSLQKQSLLRAIYMGPLNAIFYPLNRYKVKRYLQRHYKIPNREIRLLLRIFRRKAVLHRRIMLLQQIQQLFHYWHVVHKPFALVMYLVLLIHVGIAIWLGYTWIF